MAFFMPMENRTVIAIIFYVITAASLSAMWSYEHAAVEEGYAVNAGIGRSFFMSDVTMRQTSGSGLNASIHIGHLAPRKLQFVNVFSVLLPQESLPMTLERLDVDIRESGGRAISFEAREGRMNEKFTEFYIEGIRNLQFTGYDIPPQTSKLMMKLDGRSLNLQVYGLGRS